MIGWMLSPCPQHHHTHAREHTPARIQTRLRARGSVCELCWHPLLPWTTCLGGTRVNERDCNSDRFCSLCFYVPPQDGRPVLPLCSEVTLLFVARGGSITPDPSFCCSHAPARSSLSWRLHAPFALSSAVRREVTYPGFHDQTHPVRVSRTSRIWIAISDSTDLFLFLSLFALSDSSWRTS